MLGVVVKWLDDGVFAGRWEGNVKAWDGDAAGTWIVIGGRDESSEGNICACGTVAAGKELVTGGIIGSWESKIYVCDVVTAGKVVVTEW
jgi:hypothetical protein